MLTCPECGGNMRFQASIRRYVCLSCGLSLTRDEIDEIRAKYRDEMKGKEEEKEKKKEYIKWWTSSKK
ncbi:MAG: transposase [Candidatus Methanomethyliaceae archaeon]|nr:transposase [Candidatus Methanomethyliaceae archaeon]